MHTYVIRAYTQCFFVSVCACGLSLLTRTRPITQKQCAGHSIHVNLDHATCIAWLITMRFTKLKLGIVKV